ncbi:hypothetical protein D3C71_1231790 [compost metagenome]
MLGTSNTSVTPSSCKDCNAALGLKPRCTTTDAPARNWPINRPSPATWNSGATSSTQLSASVGTVASRATPALHKFACVSIAPLGNPVVPPV